MIRNSFYFKNLNFIFFSYNTSNVISRNREIVFTVRFFEIHAVRYYELKYLFIQKGLMPFTVTHYGILASCGASERINVCVALSSGVDN